MMQNATGCDGPSCDYEAVKTKKELENERRGRPREKEVKEQERRRGQTGMDLLLFSGLSTSVVVTQAGIIPILSISQIVRSIFFFRIGWMDSYRGCISTGRGTLGLSNVSIGHTHPCIAANPTSGQKKLHSIPIGQLPTESI